MSEVLHLVVRILVGWSGISFIVGGLWIVVATPRIRVDKSGLVVAAALIVIGIALLWGALNLL